MINRAHYKRLCAMSPAAQFWEKRYIAYTAGAYHQNIVQETLELIEYAIQKHRDQDQEENTAAPLIHVSDSLT